MRKLRTVLLTGVIFCAVSGSFSPYSAGADPAFAAALTHAALERTNHRVRYDGSYRAISYPNGDVPKDVGVCSDVVIRSYRAVGIDLQRALHEDMRVNFARYPKKWGLLRPDPNIDHRRVPNLQIFFSRHGLALPVSDKPEAYKSGDIVTWNLRRRGDLPHIGIVSDRTAADGTPLIVHNIGQGPKLENILFAYTITGHYRYRGD